MGKPNGAAALGTADKRAPGGGNPARCVQTTGPPEVKTSGGPSEEWAAPPEMAVAGPRTPTSGETPEKREEAGGRHKTSAQSARRDTRGWKCRGGHPIPGREREAATLSAITCGVTPLVIHVGPGNVSLAKENTLTPEEGAARIGHATAADAAPPGTGNSGDGNERTRGERATADQLQGTARDPEGALADRMPPAGATPPGDGRTRDAGNETRAEDGAAGNEETRGTRQHETHCLPMNGKRAARQGPPPCGGARSTVERFAKKLMGEYLGAADRLWNTQRRDTACAPTHANVTPHTAR